MTILEDLSRMVAECDRHHHFYHYKSSYQHLRYAQHLRAQGNEADAQKHFKAALFQDHLNLAAKTGTGEYDAHIKSNAIEALALYEQSLGWEPDDSMELLERSEYEKALSQNGARHERYHHHASNAHLERGHYYRDHGDLDLAIADYSKALDLNRTNTAALTARAALYEAKGNQALADADRARLTA